MDHSNNHSNSENKDHNPHRHQDHNPNDHRFNEHKPNEHRPNDHKPFENKHNEFKHNDYKSHDQRSQDQKPNEPNSNEHRSPERRESDHKESNQKGSEHKQDNPNIHSKDLNPKIDLSPNNFPKIDNNPDSLRIKNPWKIAAFVLGITALILLYSTYAGNSPISSSISGEEAGTVIIDYLNVRTGGGVNYVSFTDMGLLYEITVSYNGQNIPVFVTKDGNYFIQLALPINEEGPPENPTNQPPATNQEPINVSEDDDAFEGSADAPITIVEFSDYECPFCERFFTETLPLLRINYIETGIVKLVFRDYPLNDIHPNAQKAAEAAECAGQQNKYFEMHDKLFQNQQALSIENLKQYAKDLKLNQQAFDSCLDDGTMAEEVAKDFAEGSTYGVQGTPGFFINGRLIEGAQPYSAFETIIKEELEKQ